MYHTKTQDAFPWLFECWSFTTPAVSADQQPVGPGGDQEGMKHLKKTALERAKETLHQLGIIEMEGILT